MSGTAALLSKTKTRSTRRLVLNWDDVMQWDKNYTRKVLRSERSSGMTRSLLYLRGGDGRLSE